MPVYSPGYILNHLRRRSSVWIFAFFHIILKKSWRTFSNLRRDLWVECTLLYSAGRVVHLRQKNTLWIQNCPTSIHPRRTRNKSYSPRKKSFLKEVDSLPVQTRLRHDFGTTSARLRHDFGTTSALARCTLTWVGDSPRFDFPLVSSSTKKKVHRNRPSAIFPPHTSYNHKCYSFTRKKRGDGKFSPPLTATFLSVSRLSLSTWSNLESYEQTTS